jgi:hypothetical protein
LFILVKSDEGETLGRLMINGKRFSSGSVGFYGNTKLEIGDKRYQTQVQLVEIGSKNGEAK